MVFTIVTQMLIMIVLWGLYSLESLFIEHRIFLYTIEYLREDKLNHMWRGSSAGVERRWTLLCMYSL